MRTIGLDVGDVRIGVAMSDPSGMISQGHSVIERVGIRKDCGKVMDLVRQNDVGRVVIGLPLNLDGSDSLQTQKVRDFKQMLENKMRSSAMADVDLVFQDERLTTLQAERVLIEGNVSREKRKKVIDKQAAVLILQAYLDSQN